MSDDRTTDPQHPDHAGAGDTHGTDQPASPYAPKGETTPTPPYESVEPTEAPAYGTPTPPAYGASTPEAPAYGTPAPPAYGASTPEAPAYGTPTPPAYGASAPEAPAYGAPAYGAPAYGQSTTSTYGQPAYGTPNAAYGYGGAYAAQARTNVLAIISLVASLVGFVMILPVVGSIAGVIMGHISLKQIKERGERGRGMALAGVIVGYVTLAFVILFVIGISILIATAANSSGTRYGA